MKKSEYLSAVRHEVETLKRLATKEELSQLNINTFDPKRKNTCIYGQMTGCCTSKRAKVLMDEACIIVTKDNSGGVITFEGKTFTRIKHKINGKNTGQGWKNEGGNEFSSRNFGHLSALESYICLKNAKIYNIISFLRGESNELVL